MATGLNTNYQSILTQAQGEVSQLLSLTGGQKVNNYVNSIYTLINDGEAFANGNAEQRGAAIESIIAKLTNLLTSLGTRENAKANKKIQSQEGQIENNNSETKEISQTLDSKLQEIMEECAKGVKSIEAAIQEIKELGGNEGLISNISTQLEAQVSIIEDKKAILNNESADADQRKQALVAILGAASKINELVSQINNCNELIEQKKEFVKENTETIAELQVGATEVLKNGIEDLTGHVVKNEEIAAENAGNFQASVQETTSGVQQVAIGQAMTIIDGADGTKYIISGNDKLAAGATYMQGAVTNIASLAKSNGEIGSYIQNCAGFIQGINDFAEGASAIVGEFDTTVNAAITSVGSLSHFATDNTKLQEYVEQYTDDFDKENSAVQTEKPSQENETLDEKAVRIGKMDVQNATFKKFEFEFSKE